MVDRTQPERGRGCRRRVLRAAWFAIVVAACGGPARQPVEAVANRPAPVVEPGAGPLVAEAARPAIEPPEEATPAVSDQRIRLLEALAASSSGVDAIDVRIRIFEALQRHPDPARRAEALGVAAGIVAGPDWQRAKDADRLLYGFGRALADATQWTEAATVWRRLLMEFPSSRYVPDVYLAFAERFFEENDLASAEQAYRMVLKFPKASTTAYAQYKLAWVHYNLARYQDALSGFVNVAQQAGEPLRREAVKDAVRVYAEIGKPEHALAFFGKLDATRAVELVLLLGATHANHGKYAEAAATYQAVLPHLDEEQACRARRGMFEAAAWVSNRAAMVAAMDAIAAHPVSRTCAIEVMPALLDAAIAWRDEQQRTKGDPSEAIRAWELVATIGDGDELRREAAHTAASLRWGRAAFGGDAAAWADTAEAFHRLAAMGDASADGVAIDAWENATRLDRGIAPRARAALAPIATKAGPLQARARAVIASLR